MDVPPLSQIKIVLFLLAAIIFLSWLTWFLVNYFRIQRVAVLTAASQALNCPQDQIDLGPSHQFNDGPSEIPTEGCGKRTKILCTEYSSTRGIIRQYFTFDIRCAEEAR